MEDSAARDAIARLLDAGDIEGHLADLLTGFIDALRNRDREWAVDLRGVDAETAFSLGGLMGQVMQDAEARGYERGRQAARDAEQAKPDGPQPAGWWLLFDNERQQWWKPGGWGYTSDPREAGRYSRDEAVKWALQGALGGLDHATVIVAEFAALAAWEGDL